jgi:hypothetical protein
MNTTTQSAINHPPHYQACRPEVHQILLFLRVPEEFFDKECILAIEAIGAGFHDGNAIKYLWRYGAKGKPREDLDKALWSALSQDIGLCDRLAGANPKHLSPFEHQAMALPSNDRIGNFVGWKQYRKEMEETNGGNT